MNKYLVVYKVTHFNYNSMHYEYRDEILNDIIENEKLNEDLFKKIYNKHTTEMVCILNVIKLDKE